MVNRIINKFLNVELIEWISGGFYEELTLYDRFDKGNDFEQDVKSIVEELRDIYYKVEYEFYYPKDCREFAFIKYIE